MHFYTHQIVTKPVSMEEAAEASKNKEPERSLEDILADIGAKHVKTASTKGKAQKEAEKAEDDKKETPSAESKETDKEEKEEKEENCVASQDESKAVEVDEVDDSEIVELEENSKAKEKKASKKPVVLKVAKKDDFRQWTAEDVVKAWDNYGNMKACVASTKDRISNPDIWCGLLRVASTEAGKILKAASQKNKKQKKQAKKQEEAPKESKVAFRKIAKLPKKDLQLLRGYWARLYGEDYVAAMLDEYAD